MKNQKLLTSYVVASIARLIRFGKSSPSMIAFAALLGSVLITARAQAQTLTFEGIKDEETVNNYYNGGLGGSGSGPGPNYGISFANATALIQDQNGGTGNEANLPSGDTCINFFSGVGDVMNDPVGFRSGFSFYYCSISYVGAVQVYSGLNDTGTLLATLTLPITPEVTPVPDGGLEPFDNFQPIGVTFAGVAESVNFTGTANQIVFDNITINSTNPNVPEPASLGLLSTGGFLLLGRRAKRKAV